MKPRKNNSESGFTLIEVIITLVIVAVVAAMMTAYFGTGITKSSLPIFGLKRSAELNDVMEKISAKYGEYPQWQKSKAYAAGAIIAPTTSNRTGLLYTTTSGGTSGITEPTDWMNVVGGAVSVLDGSVTWTISGAAPTLALLAEQVWKQSKIYSANSIVFNGNNQYITRNGGTSGTVVPSWGTAITGTPPTTWTATESTGPLPRVVWQHNGYIGAAPTVVLKTLIGAEGSDQSNLFGSYHVVDNKFITFTSPPPATEVFLANDAVATYGKDYGKYLKVTISNTDGGKLTTLFVAR